MITRGKSFHPAGEQSEGEEHKPQLLRALGLREGLAIHISAIIGSGIFIVPAAIAGHLHAMGLILLVWVLGGLLSLFGALTVAELSSLMPSAGGPYIYLRESFGRVWGYMFSWNHFFINTAGSLAAIAVAFAAYLGYFFPSLSPQTPLFAYSTTMVGLPVEISVKGNQVVAMVVIGIATVVNVRGVRLGGWVTNVFTMAKILALLAVIVAVFSSGKGSVANFMPWWPDHWSSELTSAFGLAMISVLWSYEGWTTVTQSASEMVNPEKNIPRSLLFGTLAIIFLYLGVNLAYAYVIPIGQMAGSERIAADAASLVLGPVGTSLVIIGILCSTFGTINNSFLSDARSMYAAGADSTFAPSFGKIHPRFRTPYVTLIALGVWSALLTLSGSYDQIASYVIFGSWMFYGLTALSVIVLRRKIPDAPRPYRAWGYPYATLLFVVAAGWILINTLVEDPRDAVVGIVLLLLSLPFYFYWRKRENPEVRMQNPES
ncbi:MAG: amino acid permease [Bacteroidota bacterium]|jgi:APA family basic amino acid/polyamine antiporter